MAKRAFMGCWDPDREPFTNLAFQEFQTYTGLNNGFVRNAYINHFKKTGIFPTGMDCLADLGLAVSDGDICLYAAAKGFPIVSVYS